MGPVLLTPMVTKPVWGSNQPVLTPDWVRLTKPVLETATIEVVPETMRSLLPATTPVRPEPFPTKLVAEMVPYTSSLALGLEVLIPTLPPLATKSATDSLATAPAVPDGAT